MDDTSNDSVLVLNAAEVRKALPMDKAIDAMREAFAACSRGKAKVPLRTHLPIPSEDGVTLVMLAFVESQQGNALSVKVVSVFPKNVQRGCEAIQGLVLAFDPQTGKLQGLIQGSSLTAIRTGAASGLATDLLARADSRVLGLFGVGVQARTQLEAIATVRSIKTVWIYAPRREAVESFIREVSAQEEFPRDIRIAKDAKQAVQHADIVSTATTSSHPVFNDEDLKPGVHINAVGAHLPTMREIPPETIVRATVVVETCEAAWAEAGDIIQPFQAGLINRDHLHAELGDLVLRHKSGRHSLDQITLFKSVGIGAQDAIASRVVLSQAQDFLLGKSLSL